MTLILINSLALLERQGDLCNSRRYLCSKKQYSITCSIDHNPIDLVFLVDHKAQLMLRADWYASDGLLETVILLVMPAVG